MPPASERLAEDASKRRRRLLSQQNSEIKSSRKQLPAAEPALGGPTLQRSSATVDDSGRTAVKAVDRGRDAAQARRTLKVSISAARAPQQEVTCVRRTASDLPSTQSTTPLTGLGVSRSSGYQVCQSSATWSCQDPAQVRQTLMPLLRLLCFRQTAAQQRAHPGGA